MTGGTDGSSGVRSPLAGTSSARLQLLTLTIVWLFGLLGAPASARAERFESLVLGPELRVRERHGALTPPRYELLLPHGLHAAHGELVARVGVVLPSTRAAALAFPLTVGVRYLPVDWVVRPLLGADLGGYFTFDRASNVRSRASEDASTDAGEGDPERSHAEWSWNVRALLGAQLSFNKHVALRLYGDVSWSAPHALAHVGELFATGLGLGCELTFTFVGPRLSLLDMLLYGTDAPEGF